MSLIFVLAVPFIWLSVILFPRKIAAKITKTGARLILLLSACRITVRGRKHLDEDWPLIIVVNHASYLDSLLLVAYLPTSCVFVGKKELLDYPIIRTFIKKLDYLTVDRIDFSKSASDMEKIVTALAHHKSIIIFLLIVNLL